MREEPRICGAPVNDPRGRTYMQRRHNQTTDPVLIIATGRA